MTQPKQALIVIDLQNDYFPGGRFPLWNPEGVLENAERAIRAAHAREVPVVLVQHVVVGANGKAPFFNEGTDGAAIHPRIRAAAPNAPVVTKAFADAFAQTDLAATLQGLGAEELLICGMMTQNCVTHTALSRAADAYGKVSILQDACTTVSEILHLIALRAMTTTRVALTDTGAALGNNA